MKNYVEVPHIPSVEGQLENDIANWLFNSHCWTRQGNRLGYVHCVWCGWVPPSPLEISRRSIPLCPKNPEILKLTGEKNGDSTP